MVFRIRYAKFEALERQACSDGESCTMTATAIAFADLHLLTTTEVITSSDIDALSDKDIGTYGKMLNETGVPSVEAREGCRETQGAALNSLEIPTCKSKGIFS